MSGLASSGSAAPVIIWIVVLVIGAAVYWTPSIVAWRRHVPNLVSVVVINAFLGWTLVAWAICLAWAVKDVPPPPVEHPRQYIP